MFIRRVTRIFVLVMAVGLAVGYVLPVSEAHAHHSEPPFEVRFPQDVLATSFHNDWGKARSDGRAHAGTDLMAARKMVEVYAFADGVIDKINESPRPGRYLHIDHGYGWSSLYIHLNDDNPGTDDGEAPWYLTLAPGVEEGATVKAGQLIGWAGDSGNAEGASPHTHFELHYDGGAINPYPLLSKAFKQDQQALFRTEQLFLNQTSGFVLIV